MSNYQTQSLTQTLRSICRHQWECMDFFCWCVNTCGVNWRHDGAGKQHILVTGSTVPWMQPVVLIAGSLQAALLWGGREELVTGHGPQQSWLSSSVASRDLFSRRRAGGEAVIKSVVKIRIWYISCFSCVPCLLCMCLSASGGGATWGKDESRWIRRTRGLRRSSDLGYPDEWWQVNFSVKQCKITPVDEKSMNYPDVREFSINLISPAKRPGSHHSAARALLNAVNKRQDMLQR